MAKDILRILLGEVMGEESYSRGILLILKRNDI